MNMNINNHILLLINKYKLQKLYLKYKILSILTSITREGFYWLLLFFSSIIDKNANSIYVYSIVLALLLIIHIPVENIFNNIKSKLIEELKFSNTKYFLNKIINIDKKILLNFDLNEYYNMLLYYNDNIENYIISLKIVYDIPLRFISLLIIAITSNNYLLIGIFGVFIGIISSLNQWKYIKENSLLNKQILLENKIKNYIINSKSHIINDEVNKKYLFNNIIKHKKSNKNISFINNKLDININICIFIYIIIILINKIHTLTPSTFLCYFLLTYDIEYIGDKLIEYYKNKKIINKMQIRLNYLNNIIINNSHNKNNILNNEKLEIKITKLENKNPILYCDNIIIKQNDHILVSGISGSGKTSLLYILKGIIKVDNLIIEPNINLIKSISYLTLSNHKNLYNDYLYNIITNYANNPDKILIDKILLLVKLNHKFNNNKYVIIEKLSTGERVRLIIARIIYVIKTKNYKILLFDEIDENLNNDLALEICNNIKNIFHDKIILYITHNEEVKKLFTLKLFINNGKINYQ